MPDRTFEILASLYGEEFADKEMRKHPFDLHVKYNNYDIILVESPSRFSELVRRTGQSSRLWISS